MSIVTHDQISKERWNQFVCSHEHPSFLQSWEWGDLQEKEGRRVHRFVVNDNQEWRIGAQVIVYSLPLGRCYGYIPRGPVGLDSNSAAMVRELHSAMKAWAPASTIFVRVDPPLTSDMTESTLMDAGFRKAPAGVERSAVTQPASVAVVDLRPSEEDILGAMKSKSRYNVRLAQRRGVTTRILAAQEALTGDAFDRLYALLQQTAERSSFYLHPRAHYRHLLEVFQEQSFIVEAHHEGDILASLLVLCWGGGATYVHGGSSRKKSEHMAPFLAQWSAMRTAKERGCQWYDLGAIADDDQDSGWRGLTRFKMGFGATARHYSKAHDAVFSPAWYWLYGAVQHVRNR